MARLVKRLPRFARRPAQRFSADVSASPALWAHILAARSGALTGLAIDPQSALSLTAYYAGVRVISEDTASLPVAVFRRKPKGGSKFVRDHPITKLFNRSPAGTSNEMPSMQWREAWIAHCLGWGNGYAEIDWSASGEFLGLELMHPEKTRPVRDASKTLFYENDTAPAAGGPRRIPASKVLHLAGLGFNGLQGYSPVTLAREAIGLGKSAELFGASLFNNGAVPKGFLKHPGRMKPEAITNLRESWNAVHQGVGNANRIGILEEGMDWVGTQISPDDAQFLATRQFQVLEIARMLRLPPHKIGDYSQAHLANIEASNLDYLMTCLRPWCVRVEQCMQLKLLSDDEHDAGFYVRHDIRALLRAAIKDRSLYYREMFSFGMSPNEIFELEEMNPIDDEDGGNLRFRSANTVPLTDIVTQAAPTPPPPEATGPTAPGDTDDSTSDDGEDDTGAAGYSSRLNGHYQGHFVPR